MTATQPRLPLLVDQNVPEDVASLFAERGHLVQFSRDALGPTALDLDIADLADRRRAIEVTWDRDFARLLARAPVGTRQPYRHASRISFVGCRYALGRRRLARFIDLIEIEWAGAQHRHDKRLLVTIRPHQCIIEG